MPEARTRLPEIMARHQKEILEDWLRRQGEALGGRRDVFSPQDLAHQSAALLDGCAEGRRGGARQSGPAGSRSGRPSPTSPPSAPVKACAAQTATFVFSLKQPLFARLRRELGQDAQALGEETWVGVVAKSVTAFDL